MGPITKDGKLFQISDNASAEDKEIVDVITKSDKLKILRFSAEWCAPCKAMDNWYNNIIDKNKGIDFIHIDLGERSSDKIRNREISDFFEPSGTLTMIGSRSTNPARAVKRASISNSFVLCIHVSARRC